MKGRYDGSDGYEERIGAYYFGKKEEMSKKLNFVISDVSRTH